MTKLLLIEREKIQEVQMGQEITVGRAYSNLLRLEGEEVSRVHAIIYKRGAEYILRDLDSKNGLLLNGHRVSMSVVAPGDSVQVGKYHIVFEPPADFDLTRFLRRNGLPVPPDILAKKGGDLETGSGLPKKGDPAMESESPGEPEDTGQTGGVPPSDTAGAIAAAAMAGDALPVAGDDAELPSIFAKSADSVPSRGPMAEDDFSDQSVQFKLPTPAPAAPAPPPVPAGPPEIFYDLADIERMLAAKETSQSPSFALNIVKLHRGMSGIAPPGEEGEDGAGQQQLLDLVVEVLGGDRGVIVFQDSPESLRLGAIAPRETEVSVNRVVLKAALREKKAVLCNDPRNDPRFKKTETVRKDRIGSLIAFPLLRGKVAVGLVYVDTQERTNAFRIEHLPLLKVAGSLLLLTGGSSPPSSAGIGKKALSPPGGDSV